MPYKQTTLEERFEPVCHKCGQIKPLIHHHKSYEPEIVVMVCKSCHKLLHNRLRREGICKIPAKRLNEMSTKAYWESAHGNARQKAYDHAHKEQLKARQKTYRESHREQRNEYRRAYYQAHKEQIKARQKAYDHAHKEQPKASRKAYWEAHKEQIKEQQKAYRQSHKEQIKAYRRAYWKSRRSEPKHEIAEI